MRTMCCRKGIVNVEITIGSNGTREFRIVLFLTRPKARVFEERDIPIRQYTNRLCNHVARYFGHEHNLAAKHLLQGIEDH